MESIPLLVEPLAWQSIMMAFDPISYVDSHTEGEPTRVITAGAPPLGTGPVSKKLERLREADWFRQCVILEPRGSDAVVGAVLCEPEDARCATGVIFINNAGYLGMCGHGAIGVAVTLHYLGRIGLGKHLIETPVGVVEVNLLEPNRVAIENVPSYRLHRQVTVDVSELGHFTGDVAWGGNWFFLTETIPCPLTLDNVAQLNSAAGKIRTSLFARGITGADGAEIDHVEFFAPPSSPQLHSKNFVYCPGGAYDRSPCGTGTSAKLACLADDGKLAEGAVWLQESIIGSHFEASYRNGAEHAIIPTITGRAFVCGEGNLIRQPDDPFVNGISG